MFKSTMFAAFCFCTAHLTFGQGYYNQSPEFLKANSVWAFQKKTGLDFRNGAPIPISSAITSGTIADEGAASVCDPNTGQLLFYSNGTNVWNKNGAIMPNGTGLLSGYSTAQGVCIVPVINEPGRYYVFSLYGASNPTYPVMNTSSGFASLSYSIVDMSLDGGSGDIVPAQKNIKLSSDSLSEAMIAIPGNNCDIWLVVHKLIDPVFLAFHITASGIDTIPVISETGAAIKGKGSFLNPYAYKISCMAVSPDRSRIGITSAPGIFLGPPPTELCGALVCKFNSQDGKVSDAIKITESIVYGVAFSPDNTRIYLGGAGLPQFDISNHDSLAIVNSRVNIAGSSLDTYLRLYRDTLYCMENTPGTNPPQLPAIHIIAQPNKAGLACDYKPRAILFNTDTTAQPHLSLPNEVVFPMPGETFHSLLLDTLVCVNQIRLQAPDEHIEYTWEDGTRDQGRTVTVPGKYWVWSKGSCHDRIDTFVIDGGIEKPVIRINEFELSTLQQYTRYQWMYNGEIVPGATSSKYNVEKNGNYQVIGTNEKGCIDTSDIYVVNNVSVTDPGKITTARIFPNPAQDHIFIQSPIPLSVSIYDIHGKLCMRMYNPEHMSTAGLANGLYLLMLHNEKGEQLQAERLIINK